MKKKRFLRVLMLACVLLCATALHAQEPYAVLSNDNTVLTFYYDNQKAERGGMGVGPFNTSSSVSWYNQRSTITTVVFDASFADCTSLTSTRYWFDGLSKLNAINGTENLKTDNVTDMYAMFNRCSSLTCVDVSGFNTENVTDMGWMFNECSKLTSLDVSGFKTDNVTNMGTMFQSCSALTSLDVSGFKTDNVTNMETMFSRCSGLTALDVSGFKTDKVTSMTCMFQRCSGLTSLDVSGFKTDNVTDMSYMFSLCSKLTGLDVSGFKTDNVTYMSQMFASCSGLTSLNVSGFKTDKVAYMRSMFSGCSGLTSLDVSGFNTDNVTNMSQMFASCSGLTSLDVSGFKTDNVTDMSWMFSGCSGLTSLDVSGFKTDNVTNMSFMFQACSGLTSLDVSGFNTDNVTDLSNMFRLCSGLKELDLSNFMTDNVTNMASMLYFCSGLTRIYAGDGWTTDNVTSGGEMFINCTKLVGGQGTTFDWSHTDYTYARIDGGAEAPGYFTYKSGNTEPETPDYKDGELFTAKTPEGVTMTFVVISAADKTCKTCSRWGVNTANTCIDENTTGTVTVPSEVNGFKVVEIGEWTLRMLNGLTAINISEGITTIGFQAIALCDNITSIMIPASVTSIDGGNFSSCHSLTSIVVNSNNPVYDSRNNCNAVVETATNKIVAGCNTTVLFEGIKAIGKNAFWYVLSLSTLNLPSTVTSIEDYGFSSCRNLQTVVVPKTVTSMGLAPFATCNNLKSLSVEDGNPNYDSRNNCNAIIETSTDKLICACNVSFIPEGIKTIGLSAFTGLESIEEITIPKSVESIENAAFYWCSNLKTVKSFIEEPFVPGYNSFGRKPEDATLYVPAGTKALYEATDGWKEFPNIVEMDGQTAISTVTNGMKTSGTVYNLSGQRVESPAKGIFIRNGKKFVVK